MFIKSYQNTRRRFFLYIPTTSRPTILRTYGRASRANKLLLNNLNSNNEIISASSPVLYGKRSNIMFIIIIIVVAVVRARVL